MGDSSGSGFRAVEGPGVLRDSGWLDSEPMQSTVLDPSPPRLGGRRRRDDESLPPVDIDVVDPPTVPTPRVIRPEPSAPEWFADSVTEPRPVVSAEVDEEPRVPRSHARAATPRRVSAWWFAAAGVVVIGAATAAAFFVGGSDAEPAETSTPTAYPISLAPVAPAPASAPAPVSPAAPAQPAEPAAPAPTRALSGAAIGGKIESNDGSTIVMRELGGQTVTVIVDGSTQVLGPGGSSLGDLDPGDNIVVQGELSDTTITARAIVVTTV